MPINSQTSSLWPKKPVKKNDEPHIPSLQWKDDLVWKLISELEKPENFKVPFGKKDPAENTSPETKLTVFKRIGSVIFPELFETSPERLGAKIRSKNDDLIDKYKKHAQRLQKTGEGLGGGSEQLMDFYIPPDGPNEHTSNEAKNIWDEILHDFPFFGRMHSFLCTRPNVIPHSVTTGVGPAGHKTVYYQNPYPSVHSTVRDEDIDPALKDSTPGLPSTGSENPEDPEFTSDDSDLLPQAKEKAKKAVKGKKRPLEHLIMDAQRDVLASVDFQAKLQAENQARMADLETENINIKRAKLIVEQEKNELEKKKLALDERKTALDLFEAGILDKEEVCKELDRINAEYA